MSDESKELAKVEAPDPIIAPKNEGLVVLATEPDKVSTSHQALIPWVDGKLKSLATEREDAETNLETARKNKWKVAPWKKVLKRCHERITFYTKFKTLVEQGYHIVPNFPVDVIAIRTDKETPRQHHSNSRWGTLPDQRPSLSQAGEGEYKNPKATEDFNEWEDGEGDKKRTHIDRWADEFQEVEFPFIMAKPAIVEATSRAMADKVFDDIGILPGRPGRAPIMPMAQRKGARADPMIIGRIHCPKSATLDNTVSFMLGWFFDTNEMP